eukprot:SAG31_NODE_489_length_14938_cov_5.644113_17_plen_164_part_00
MGLIRYSVLDDYEEEIGPYTAAQLGQLLQSAVITPQTYVMPLDDPEADDYTELWKGLHAVLLPPTLKLVSHEASSSPLKNFAAPKIVPRLVSLVSLYPRGRGRRRRPSSHADPLSNGTGGNLDNDEMATLFSTCEVFGRRLLREHLLIGCGANSSLCARWLPI